MVQFSVGKTNNTKENRKIYHTSIQDIQIYIENNTNKYSYSQIKRSRILYLKLYGCEIDERYKTILSEYLEIFKSNCRPAFLLDELLTYF